MAETPPSPAISPPPYTAMNATPAPRQERAPVVGATARKGLTGRNQEPSR